MPKTTTNEIVKLDSPKALEQFATKLKDFIVRQGLYAKIQGKNFVNIEGWQFAGGNMGLFPVVESCERLDRKDEIAYKASVAIYSGERIVSRGIAICSSKENNRTDADEYVIASMSQTRAEGKAYRLILGWLMKVAGYEATPSEEMESFKKKGSVNKKTYDPEVEMAPFCDKCGAEGIKQKWGWSCPNWKEHKEKGEKFKMVQAKEERTGKLKEFEDSLDEIK